MNRKERRASGKADLPPGASPPNPLTLHAMGLDAFRAGQLEMAADLIGKALAINDQVPAFHYNLGIVQKARGKLKDAAACYQHAIMLKPDHTDAHNNLGNVWKSLDKPDKARASFERALLLKPGNPDTLYNLGVLCSEAGDAQEAARHFLHYLEQDPEDSRGARILLAQMGRGRTPEHASHAQMQSIYGARARFWDQESRYFGHLLVAQALQDHAGRTALDILDIGCGTGLVGTLVRAQIPSGARILDGIDLSPAMLEKAREKGVYDRLDQADIVSFLAAHKGSYDAILGAAILIHFGDLQAVFQAAAQSLRANGLFIFTLFCNDDADFAVAASDRLAQSGCYAHSIRYVERLAPECGFSVLKLEQVVHEHDPDGNPVPGFVTVLQRA
jgi:predicted TPR repeat methyltransferase